MLLCCDLGGGLSLHLPRLRDAQEVFELIDRHREVLGEWLPWVAETRSAGDTEAFFQKAREWHAKEHALHLLIRQGGLAAGMVGMHVIDRRNGKASFGYWLAPTHWGRGLVTRAVGRLLRFAFEEEGLQRAEIRCAPENARSRAVAERLGFRLEGRLRRAERLSGDRYVDHLVFGLLRSEWRSEAAS